MEKVDVVKYANMGVGVELFVLFLPVSAFPNIFLPSNKHDSLRAMLKYVYNESIPGTDL
jgi:hypothetical protein